MIKQINLQSFSTALEYAVDFCLQNKDEIVDIVVPDKLSLFMERFLFEKLNISSSFNIRVSTLNRFAKRNLLIDKSKQITNIGSIILVNKILNDNREKFSVLKNDNFTFSYAENIFKTIYQLKASNIKPEEMLKFSSINLQLQGKIHDLALIYTEYENNKAGLIDASDMFLMSVFNISQNRENNKILIVGFDDFTSIEYSLIERLAVDCEISVINYVSNKSNRYIYNTEVSEQLKHIAMTNIIPYEVVDYTKQSSNLKQFLADNLFGIDNNQFVIKNEIVKIFSANSVDEEIENTARDIRRRILSGQQYSTFGVAVFDLANKTDKIAQIFKKYDINFYLDTPLNINRSIFYKFMLSVLKFNLEYNNLPHIIDIINSPFFEFEQTQKQQLIQQLITIQFKGKSLDNLKNDGLEQILNAFSKFLKLFTFKPKDKLKDIKQILIEADNLLGFDSLIDKISQGEDLTAIILLKKSKEIIFDLFDEIEKFYNDADVKTFYDIFINIGSVVEINNLPLTLDAVKVVDANNFAECFDNLYMLNCTNENAPAIKADCGIILDSEIAQLNFSNKLSPTIAHINNLSRLRLYNSSLLFNKSLTISYNKTQSILIKELCKKLLVELGGAKYNLMPDYNLSFGKVETLSNWDYIETLHKYSTKLEKTIKNIPKDKNFINLSTESLNIYNSLNKISATYLENYFKCPFYAFLSNTLKIKPRLESEILMLDIGNILHEIIFKYYNCNKQVDDIYNFAKTEIYNYLKREARLQINLTSPIIAKLIDEVIRVVNGLNYIDKNSKFEPKYFEYEFDSNAVKLNDTNLIGKVDRIDEFDNGQTKQFRIIDYKSQNADATVKELYYGKKLQLFLYNVAIQNSLKNIGIGSFYLPLHNKYQSFDTNSYCLNGFFVNDAEVVHALDERLEPGQKSDIVNITMSNDGLARKYGNSFKALTEQQFNDLKNYSVKVSSNAVQEIKSGYIEPTPLAIKSPCNYCPYAQICLKNSHGIVDRATADINLSSFEE